MVIKSANNSWL